MSWTDKIVPSEALEQEVMDITSRLSKGESEVKVFGDKKCLWATDELSLSTILAIEHLKKEFKLKPLTWRLTKKEKYTWGAAFLFIMMAWYFFNSYQEHQKNKARLLAIEKQQSADSLSPLKTAVLPLKPPWGALPSVSHFIRRCDEKIQDIPLSSGGWRLAQIDCSHDKATVLFARLEGASVGAMDFKSSVKRRYGAHPTFNIRQPDVATFFLPLHHVPEGEDPLLPLSPHFHVNRNASFRKENGRTRHSISSAELAGHAFQL